MNDPVRVPRAFAEKFKRVTTALAFDEEDIRLAKEGVRRDFDAWREFVETEDDKLRRASSSDRALQTTTPSNIYGI